MTIETRAAAAAEKEAERVAQARDRIAERDDKVAKVREQLDKVAAHPRLGKKVVKEILDKQGKGKKLPEPGVESVHDMKAKQFDDVSERCKEILLEQPSAEDEELIKKIDKAASAEDKALNALQDFRHRAWQAPNRSLPPSQQRAEVPGLPEMDERRSGRHRARSSAYSQAGVRAYVRRWRQDGR